jgi:hypothetical protein
MSFRLQESTFRAPKQRVEDFEELHEYHEYHGRKRKKFDERVRRTRGCMWVWRSVLVVLPLNIVSAKNGLSMQIGRYVT